MVLFILYFNHRKYHCHIRVADKDKKFLINLRDFEVHAKELEFKGKMYNIIITMVISIA